MSLSDYLPFSSGSTSSAASPEPSPDDSEHSDTSSAQAGPTVDPEQDSSGFLDKFTSFIEDVAPDVLVSEDRSEPGNEQPTNYNPIFVGAVLSLVAIFLCLIYFFPSGSSSPKKSQKSSSEQPSIADRKKIPGLKEQGKDPSKFFTQDKSSNQNPPLPSGKQTQKPEPQTQEQSAEEAPAPDDFMQKLQSRPPGAPSQGKRAVPSNPYQQQGGSPTRQPGSRGPSKSLKKAMSSKMSIKTEPPGNFDPAKEGIPRDPASGRPLGSAPTPSETRKEAKYDQQKKDKKNETPQEELNEQYPVGSNLSKQKKFLARQQARSASEQDVTQVQGPFSPFVLPKGTIIPIVLESKTNSDVPGATVMRVTRDVYDRTYRHILIPRGSEVVSSYSTSQRVGQDRILVVANRLNLPDGRYVKFSDTRAAGPTGAAGLSDVKDRHLLSRFAAAGGLAVLGAVVGASNPLGFLGLAQQDSSGVIAGGGVRGGFGRRLGTSLSQQINQVIAQLLQKQVNRQPTLKLRPGLRGLLIINEDINFKRPYYESGGDFRQQNRQYLLYKQNKQQREMRRAIRRVQKMTRQRQRTRQLRKRTQKMMRQGGSSNPPTSSLGPNSNPQFYVDELRKMNRQGSTFIPPRRGPTARERFVYGQNYRRTPPSQVPKQFRSDPAKDSTAARPRMDESVPKQLRVRRREKWREDPEQYRPWDRPMYNRQRPSNRYSRGKQSYRPRPTGRLNAPSPQTPQNPSKTPPPGSAERSSNSPPERN